jgi:hypothetical protein
MKVRELIAKLQKHDPDADAWFGWKTCEPVSVVENFTVYELQGDWSATEPRGVDPDSEKLVVLIR